MKTLTTVVLLAGVVALGLAGRAAAQVPPKLKPDTKAVVADRPTMIVRRKSPPLHPLCIIRIATAMEIVNATPTRRAVFAIKPAGLAAVASSDIAALRIPLWT